MQVSERVFNIGVPALLVYFLLFENFLIAWTANPNHLDEIFFMIYNSCWYLNYVLGVLEYQRKWGDCKFLNCCEGIVNYIMGQLLVKLNDDMVLVAAGFTASYWDIIPRFAIKVFVVVYRGLHY